MTITIPTILGKIKVSSDFKISKFLRLEIERNLRHVVEDIKPIEELEALIKKSIPWAGTPRGALVGYKTARGWTQKQLSRKTGIPQGNLSQMINGKRPIGITTAKKLAKAFGVDHTRFL